ncbi:MAG: hypothetical protein ACRC8R_11950 [Aeromonas hydrophila]
MTISLIHALLACVALLALGFMLMAFRVKSMAGQLSKLAEVDSSLFNRITKQEGVIGNCREHINHLEVRLRRLEGKPSLAPADPAELRPDEVQYWREKLADLQHNAELYGLILEYSITIDPDA